MKTLRTLAIVPVLLASIAGSAQARGGREVPNGGDGCELLAAALSDELIADLKGPIGRHLPEIDVRKLEAVVYSRDLEIVCVGQPKAGTRDREAVNYVRGRRIELSRSRFGNGVNRAIQKPLLLHEFLPLIYVDDGQYAISKRYTRFLKEDGSLMPVENTGPVGGYAVGFDRQQIGHCYRVDAAGTFLGTTADQVDESFCVHHFEVRAERIGSNVLRCYKADRYGNILGDASNTADVSNCTAGYKIGRDASGAHRCYRVDSSGRFLGRGDEYVEDRYCWNPPR